jgi:histidinol-phosphate aminotransferase
MIKHRDIFKNLIRNFDPYKERMGFVRLDRNEDPVGYSEVFFKNFLDSLTVHDFAAYSDSINLVKKLSSWTELGEENFYICAGSDAAIKNIFECFIEQGDKIILQNPSWRMYDVYAAMYGADIKYVDYGDNLSFDTAKVLPVLENEHIKMLILANPNQPTGTLIPSEEICKILEKARQKDTLVIIDEAYHLFTPETSISYVNNFNNLIIVRTFSKAFGAAGLRIGYAVSNSNLIKYLMLLKPVTDSNSVAIKFAEYLLDNFNVVKDKIEDFMAGRSYLYQRFLDNNLTSHISHTNFLLLKCQSFEKGLEIINQANSYGYLLKGPFAFKPLENYIRITVGPLNLMQQFWNDCGQLLMSNASQKRII